MRTSASADRRTLTVAGLAALTIVIASCTSEAEPTTTSEPATTATSAGTTTSSPTTLPTRPAGALDPEDLHVVFVWAYDEPVGLTDVDEIDPSARLHAARHYQDLAAAVAAVPATAVVIAPGATVLRDLAALSSGADDELLRLATAPVAGLTDAERALVVERFFDVPASELDRFPRLAELRDQRRRGIAFDDEDVRDLQVLFGLAWLDLDHADSSELETVLARSRGFDEVDRAVVAAAHREAAAKALASWQALASSGHAEPAAISLGDSVMPLLIDGWSGAASDPDGTLPPNRLVEQTDALAVARRGMDPVEDLFGTRPAGIVPGGGSLSSTTAEILDQAGVTWTITGEDSVARSLGFDRFRSGDGVAQRPDDLYRPWATPEGPVVFAADRVLSEAISNRYSSIDPSAAATDFVRRLEAIAASTTGPAVVTVVVDGSEPWRHHEDGGAAFLRTLFERIAEADAITTTTPSAYLEAFGTGTGALFEIWPGSLLRPDLTPWVGDAEEAAAWNLLWRVRFDLRLLSREGKVSDDEIFEAFDAMHLAQASGWFRWFGGDADSGDDRAVDRLFREILGRVYDRLSEPREEILDIPLIGERPDADWSAGDVALSIEWTGEGPEVTVDLPADASGFDLFTNLDLAEEIDSRPASLNGTPLGFDARGAMRWSRAAPGFVEVLDVPPFGLSEAGAVSQVPADRSETSVTFVIPVPADTEPGFPLLVRIEPVADGVLPLVPAGGPAEIMAGATTILEIADPVGDDAGAGHWIYPQDRAFTAGSFDLSGLRVGVTDTELVLQVGVVADIGDPFGAASGVSLQVFDIAIDIDPAAGTGRRSFPDGRNVALPPEHGFEALVTVDRDGARLATVAADGDLASSDEPVALRVDPRFGTITVRLPIAAIGDSDPGEWGFAVTVASSDPDEISGIRTIAPRAGQWVGGGASPDASHPGIYDLLWPEAFVQERLLADYRPAESTGNLGPDDFGVVPLVRG